MRQSQLLPCFAAVWALLLLAASPSPAEAVVTASETVSLSSLLPVNQDFCVTYCVYGFGNAGVGGALGCHAPWLNTCYCATDSASASRANSWLSSCGSRYCSVRDVPDDITWMHSLYASYCMNAGYTQPGATNWYTMDGDTLPAPTGASPGQTTESNPLETAKSSSAPPGTRATLPQAMWLSLLLLAWVLATAALY
jgi:hypothetical protein